MKLELFLGAGMAVALTAGAAGIGGGQGDTPMNDVAGPAVATSPEQGPPSDRKYLLERIDDAAVAQLYADGFAALPLNQKVLIWHLYQAAVAGRDIFYDQ